MKSWLFWAGISFIIGGVVSLALNLGATQPPSFSEDLSGYAIGWMLVGAILIVIGSMKTKNPSEK